MVPRTPIERRRSRVSGVTLDRIENRLEMAEYRLVQLQNTLRGVAREADVSLGFPCDRCDRSYLLVKDGQMFCPECGYRQSL